jgi:hypothetical protein
MYLSSFQSGCEGEENPIANDHHCHPIHPSCVLRNAAELSRRAHFILSPGEHERKYEESVLISTDPTYDFFCRCTANPVLFDSYASRSCKLHRRGTIISLLQLGIGIYLMIEPFTEYTHPHQTRTHEQKANLNATSNPPTRL